MFCPTCGNALSQQLKYCNRCGANLATADAATIKALEKRLDEYLDGLFWLTVLGLAFIIGGMLLMKRFQFSESLILAYMVLSSAAFLVNFAINLREVQRLKRTREGTTQLEGRTPAELSLLPEYDDLRALPSVTENTTRSLEEPQNEKIRLKVPRNPFQGA
jgi:hypothetical protein